MSQASQTNAGLRHADRLFIAGEWVLPSSGATIAVVDSNSEDVFLTVAAAGAPDISAAVSSAHDAFSVGPWPMLSHTRRAEYLRAMAAELRARTGLIADILPRESGVLQKFVVGGGGGAEILEFYADLAAEYPWEERVTPTRGGQFGLIVREPVGVVGAIVPWNAPLNLALFKIGPALLAGCTVVLKASPEAPGTAYLLAEAAEAAGLPAGVLNVVTADREISELLVRDPRVDKIAFTGSTVAGRRIASIMGERIGRYTLELGGKSAAVILDDADLGTAAATLASAECFLSGQVCTSLTRLIISESRHDEFVEALSAAFSAKTVGSAFDASSDLGPLATAVQRDRVESYIEKGIKQGATLVTGGGRPKGLDRGFYIEPTVFSNVDNSSAIGQEEIFGPVLSVIAAKDERDAVRLANDTIYGLNAAVFTEDSNRAREVAARLRSGTVGQNASRSDTGIGFGGFKQSGVGREGGREGLAAYLEAKTVILDGTPDSYAT